jgi:hypothetical protein
MSDTKRMVLAAALSVLLHVTALLGGGYWFPENRTARTGRTELIVLNLRPQIPRHVVDALTPAQEAPDPTDLISDRNAKAQDMSETEGSQSAPHVETRSEFDDPGAMPRAAFAEEALVPPAADRPKQAPQKASSETNRPSQIATVVQEPSPAADLSSRQEAEAERFQVAEAERIAIPPAPSGPPEKPRGRLEGGVKSRGFTGFEAMEDEIAPYLLEIRRRVELKWRAALEIRYSGTSPTEAIVECAISPQGELAYAKTVDPGDSPSYGALCKEALETAAPFPAFPFKVPDVYRSKNLDITWTFHFLDR